MDKTLTRQEAFLGLIAFSAALAVHVALAAVVVVGSWAVPSRAGSNAKTAMHAPSTAADVATNEVRVFGPALSLPFLAVYLVIFLLPTAIAFIRGHCNRAAIFATNVFLGCTVIGWTIALIWAFTSGKDTADVHVHVER